MKKILITYSTAYGSSREYAELLGEKLLLPVSDVTSSDISASDAVIHFGSLYAGSVLGLRRVISKLPPSASLVVVSVGIADPSITVNADKIDGDIFRIIGEDFRKRTTTFHLRGRLDYSKLSAKHRAMMWMLCNFIKKKKEKTEEDMLILNTYGKRVDFFKPESIQPIAEYAIEMLS